MAQTNWTAGIQTVDEKREIKRQAILRVAAQAFNNNGFHQTSLTSLAAQLSVTKPTLYYYVKNKDDILKGIIEIAMGQLYEVINSVKALEATGLEKLRYFFERYGAVVTDDFGTCLILMRINAPEPKFREDYHTLSGEVLAAMEQVIEDGIRDGSIAACDAKYMAAAMLGTMNETVYWHVVQGRESPQAAAERFFKAFEGGLVG